MRKIRFYFVLGIILLVIDLGAGTLIDPLRKYLRSLQNLNISREISADRAVFEYSFKSNHAGQRAFGPFTVPFFTNSLGFRAGATGEVSKKKSKKRILIIGDSFTEGIGVSWEHTFSGRIESARKDWEVLNAGVASYSPAVYFSKIRHFVDSEGLEIDHAVVFIDVGDLHNELERTVGADFNVIGVKKDKSQISARDRQVKLKMANLDSKPARKRGGWTFQDARQWMRDHSLFVRFVYEVREAIGDLEQGCQPFNFDCRHRIHRRNYDLSWHAFNVMWSTPGYPIHPWVKKGQAKAEKHMAMLKTFLDTKNIPLTIAVYPWPHQVLLKDIDSRHRKIWRKWASDHGVHFVDLFPPFFRDPPNESVRKHYIPNDVHFSIGGHAVVANTFLNEWKFK
ncbi:MAG: hypothetical protein HN650_16100 [Rhodospirillaceae bacterium]|jgi:hypothetical protein|nr:hypothetical protein [Rhodospirillaceae bacterium]